MTFNPKDFNIKQVIKDRVNKEAEIEWARTSATPSIPKMERASYLQEIGRNYLKSKVKYLC